MSSTIDKALELKVSFAGSLPGSKVGDECLQEIADRMRVTLPESATGNDVEISPDPQNILQKTQGGQLRVPADTYYSETQPVPVPPTTGGVTSQYAVPVTRWRVTQVIMENGDVIPIPNEGQSAGPTYPADLDELVTNLNNEGTPFTWSNNNGILYVESNLGLGIASIVEGGPTTSDALQIIPAEVVIGPVPGDATIIFQQARQLQNIDYTAVFDIGLMVWPGSGYQSAKIENITANAVTVIIERITKPLQARLTTFTPAQRENQTEF